MPAGSSADRRTIGWNDRNVFGRLSEAKGDRSSRAKSADFARPGFRLFDRCFAGRGMRKEQKNGQVSLIVKINGGEGGIRTHGTLSRTAVFKTAALNHSATSPMQPWRVGAGGMCFRFVGLERKVKSQPFGGRGIRKNRVEGGEGRRRGLWHVPVPGALGWVGQGAQRHRNMTKCGAAGPVSWAGFEPAAKAGGGFQHCCDRAVTSNEDTLGRTAGNRCDLHHNLII